MAIRDLSVVIRDFVYLSNVFRYIESFHLKGHQIGRKVGDMLELVTLGKIQSVSDLSGRLKLEPSLEGYTGAKHKVEFAFFEAGQAKSGKPFGIIECKKVGVEVTKHQMVRDRSLATKGGDVIELPCNPRWLPNVARNTIPLVFNIEVQVNQRDAVVVRFSHSWDRKARESQVPLGGTIKVGLMETGEPFLLGADTDLFALKEIIRECAIVQLIRMTDGISQWMVLECLPGPQTIEKAKQAAFVAMDLRRKLSGKWGKEELDEAKKTFLSILVIGEVSHWEPKSRSVVSVVLPSKLDSQGLGI